MGQVAVNFRMDAELKSKMEQVCKDMGLTMTTAFKMFAMKVAREQKIPFEVSADPFYSETNIARLQAAIADLNAGKGQIHEVEYD